MWGLYSAAESGTGKPAAVGVARPKVNYIKGLKKMDLIRLKKHLLGISYTQLIHKL